MVVSTIYAFCTLTCDVRRRYAITLAGFLQGNVSLHELFGSICRIAVSSLQMAVDLKDRGPNRVEFLKSSEISKIVLKALWSDILAFMRLLEVPERLMECGLKRDS